METIDGLDFDGTPLPDPMRPLVPHYRRFAISDDADRERVIQEATAAELERLVQAVTPLWPDINAFLDVGSNSDEEVLTHALAQGSHGNANRVKGSGPVMLLKGSPAQTGSRGDGFTMLTIQDEKEVRSITPMQRIVTIAGVAGSLIAGGVIGATLAGPLAATAANNNATTATTQLTAASASPSAAAGTFKSNEDATHEAGESATVEAQENSGQRPGGGTGKFTPNENATHEAGESAAREAQENAGQRPTVP